MEYALKRLDHLAAQHSSANDTSVAVKDEAILQLYTVQPHLSRRIL